MSLFKRLTTPDRQQTQLAYRVRYWPWHELSAAGRELVTHRTRLHVSIQRAEAMLNEDKTELFFNRWHKVVWAYNNMPTEDEWNKHDKQRQITVELRCSPAIDGYSVAIFSFELPSERLNAHKNGEFA